MMFHIIFVLYPYDNTFFASSEKYLGSHMLTYKHIYLEPIEFSSCVFYMEEDPSQSFYAHYK